MRTLAAFAAGLLFAAGLTLGGMTDPANIVGFLDFFGAWKPALALVMGGAVGVYAALYPLILKRRVPLLAPAFDLPDAKRPNARLFIGAAAFGVGWGIAGICPGPAAVALAGGRAEAIVFAASLAAGIGLFHVAFRCGDPAAGDGPSSCG